MRYMIVVVLLIVLGSTSIAQKDSLINTKLQKLTNRIEVLEGQKENLATQSTLQKEKFDVEFAKHQLEVDKTMKMVYVLFGCLGLGIVGGFFYFSSIIQTRIERGFERKIDTVIEGKKEEFLALIKDQSLETELKNKSKFLVLVETIADKQYFTDFCEEVGLNTAHITFEMSETYVEPFNEFDLVIFDDHRETENRHSLFMEYITKLSVDPNNYFVFYGKLLAGNTNREQVNYANSKITFYNQIMTSLKYRHLKQNQSKKV